MDLLKRRPLWIAGGFIALAALIVAVILVSKPEAVAAPQAVKISIRGNLGGDVYADGQVTHLQAYNGTDSTTVMVSKSVTVNVTSTGAAPWCHIADSAGKKLDDQTGPDPHVVPQTFITGYGPASYANVPTWETATCTVTLSR